MKHLRKRLSLLETKYSEFILFPSIHRNFGNIAKAKNAVPAIVIQCAAALILVYGIQIPQFLFVAICHYFSTLMDDVKSMIKRFDRNSSFDDLVEMVTLHRDSLE